MNKKEQIPVYNNCVIYNIAGDVITTSPSNQDIQQIEMGKMTITKEAMSYVSETLGYPIEMIERIINQFKQYVIDKSNPDKNRK